MKDHEKIEEALDSLEWCMINTPTHLKGVLLGDDDLSKIDRALKISKKIVKQLDELLENLYKSAKLSSKATVDFINAVGRGDITINKK